MIDNSANPTTDNNRFFPTGLTVLDQRLGNQDGIPGGSMILIHMPPQSNLGTLFAQRVILNLLESLPNTHAYYMHSSRPQHVIRKEFQAYNWNVTPFENEDKWEFIDMWHITSSHVASSSRIGKIDIRRKSYLKQAYNRILQVKETDNSHCFSVVDNLLWLKEDDFDNEPSRLLDYFKELTDIIDEIGGVHFLVLPKGILSDTAEKIIMSIMNGIFDFSRTVVGNRNQDQLSIMKMMGITYQSDIMDITPDEQLGLRIESTGKI